MTSTFYRKPYTDEVRRNLATVPRSESAKGPMTAPAASNWGGTAPVRTFVNTPSPVGAYVTRLTAAAAGTPVVGGDAASADTTNRPAVTVGLPYSFGVWVRPNFAVTLRAQAQFMTGAGGTGSSSGVVNGSSVVCAANVWTFLTVENAIAPAGSVSLRPDVDWVTAPSLTTSSRIDFDALDPEQAATLPSYMDGDTSSLSATEQYRWAGTRNASQSVKYVPDPVTEIMTPLLLIGPVKQTREGRSATYDYLYSQAAASSVATVGWGGPRNGEHTMIFGTGAAGRAALDFFSGYGSFVLVDDVTPWLSMAFVIDSQGCTLEQTDAVINGGVEFRPKLTVAYREIRS